MTKNSPPSIDPTNLNSLTGTFKHVLGKMLQSTDGMLPARVIQYDRVANRVQVQPLIMLVTTLNEPVSRAQIASLPVLLLGGGGFFLSFDLNPGDLGWISVNDRDISQFLQTYEESIPNTFRVKDFADAIFIPDIMKGYTIAEEDGSNVVLQNMDGTVKISLGSDRIKVSAPYVIMEATGSDMWPIRVTGNVFVTGKIAASDTIQPSQPPPPPLPPPP